MSRFTALYFFYNNSTPLYDCNSYLSYSFLFYLTFAFIQLYALSDFEDYQREYNKSLMYRYVEFHLQSVMLHITMPSQPERRGGKGEVRRRDIAIPNAGGSGEMMMKIRINK